MLNDQLTFNPRFGLTMDISKSFKSLLYVGQRYTCEIVTFNISELIVRKLQFSIYKEGFDRYINPDVQKNLLINYFIYKLNKLPRDLSLFKGQKGRKGGVRN